MSTLSPLIVLTTGGTGGHVFPAEALATVLLAEGYRLVVVTDERGKAFSGVLGQLPVYGIPAAQMVGRGLLGKIKGGLRLAIGSVAARRLLRQLQPALVVGFGGYASVPALSAAQSLRIPTLLHEQNAVIGRANRLFAKRASRIATAFARVVGLSPAASPVWVGMPVRPAIRALYDQPYHTPRADEPLRVLVLGGSQGARIFSDVLPEAFKYLPREVRQRLIIAQQARPEDLSRVTAAYADSDLEVEIASFFSDVPARLADCHLLITRSGSSTVAEAMVAGRPTVLVPYAHAADDHQTANARTLEEAGASQLVAQADFTSQRACEMLAGLLTDPDRLTRMAKAAHDLAIPDAAERLAEVVRALAPHRLEGDGQQGQSQQGQRSGVSP